MDVDIRQRDGVTIVKPNGRIIGSASVDLREAMDAQLAVASDAPKFLIDFADVGRMDSSGLGTLVGLHVSVARKGGRIGIINVGTSIRNLIVMARLITLFEHFDSEDEAIAALTTDRN